MSNNIRNSSGYNNAHAASRKKPAAAPAPQNKVDMAEVGKITFILTAICVIITALLAGTNQLTADKIAENAVKAKQDAWRVVLPADDYIGIEVSSSDALFENLDAAIAVSGSDVGGVVITTTDKGYGGTITVLTGFDADGNITGVQMLEHSETAGLGANAAKSKFIDQFITADDEIRPSSFAVSKDGGELDAVTAATISSRAVTRAVNHAIEIYNGLYDGGYLVIPDSYATLTSGSDVSVTDALPAAEETEGGEQDE